MINRVVSAVLIFFFIANVIFIHTGCAVMVPPTGGAADSTAPKLEKATPENNTLNSREKKLVFTFDEYVELEDAMNKITISPLPSIPPEITSKLKTVTIRLKDSLEENTTYNITVNGAIKDVNEGNKLENFVYSFSTGNSIDSNTLSGKVMMAETGLLDSTLIVCLYTKIDDSTVVKERPKYVTKINGDGTFTFKNLPSKEFEIFAMSDDGGQKKYSSLAQAFAFNNTKVNAANNESNISLNAYIQEKEQPKATREQPLAATVKTRITSMLSGKQDLLSDYIFRSNRKLKNIDTSKLIFTDTNYIERFDKKITMDSLQKQFVLNTSWKPNFSYVLIIPKDFATDEKDNALTKSDTLKFITKDVKEYGKVAIRFTDIDLSKNPVLQIVQNGGIVNSYSIKSFKLNIPLFAPGEYDLRILYDANKDGKWTPGNYFKGKTQPEKVLKLNKNLNVKADWDNEIDINEKR